MENDLSKYAELIQSFTNFFPVKQPNRPFTASEIEASNVRLSVRMREAEEALTRELTALLFPNGRQEAYERIDRMCSLNSVDMSAGIDKSPSLFWKNAALRKGALYQEYREEDEIPRNLVFPAFPKKV